MAPWWQRSGLGPRIVPIALALLFALLALRGAENGAPMFPDAARHALNGALLHDMARDGGAARPVEYAARYYGRLPAISIPYHPPGFPAIEALAFSLFGVSYETARLVVAFTVFVSALLFFRLVLETHGSRLLAAAAVGVFLSIPHAQWLSQDVMLEFPSLVFVLAALLCLPRVASRPLSWGPLLMFAVLSGVAIWTKQHTVFLAAVPFGWILLSGRWRELVRLPLWGASAVLGVIGLGMFLLSRLAQAGSNKSWPHHHALTELALHHVRAYSGSLLHQLGWIGTGLVAVAVLAYGVRKVTRRQAEPAADLYMAWALAVVGLVLALGPWEPRYLIYGYPPLLVLGLATVREALATRASRSMGAVALAGVAVILAAPNLARPPDFVRGYNEAAQAVKESSRVLYCGPWNGSFIFAVRAADPGNDTSVIREDKLRAMSGPRTGLEEFLHAYGVQSVVLEDSPVHGGCDAIHALPPESLGLQTEIEVASSEESRRGRLLVYRFNNPSPTPLGVLKLPSAVLRDGIEVDMR